MKPDMKIRIGAVDRRSVFDTIEDATDEDESFCPLAVLTAAGVDLRNHRQSTDANSSQRLFDLELFFKFECADSFEACW